uniref:DNA-directed DNA polymerase n=1 Tax=viral metagenome TaxID=1070528 RepID=A0A6H1ZMB7_9ZZZZ
MKKRKFAHILKPNKTTTNPAQFLFFDTETLEVSITSSRKYHKLKLGWACYWKRRSEGVKDTIIWKYFETPEVFWDFLTSKVHSKEKLYVIAHNMVFDFTVLEGLKYLPKYDYKLTNLFEKNRLFIAIYRQDDKKIVFLDNLNYFVMPLKMLGRSIGLKKKEVDFGTASKSELLKYCKRDVEILLKTWEKWISFRIENDLGNFGITIAQQALRTYCHRFMPEKIYIHDQTTLSEFERKAYYGGRVECFKLGHLTDDFYHNVDVNSMFPSVMINNLYPVKLKQYYENVNCTFLNKLMKSYSVIAEVTLKVKRPLFPLRKEYKVIYPVGEFTTFLCTPELKVALKRNQIKKILKIAIYEQADIFSDYVRYFYNKKQKAQDKNNSADALFYKYMLNTLYGKFGQKGGEWIKVGENPPDIIYMIQEFDSLTGEHYYLRSINGLVQKRVEEGEAFHSFVAISAHVTSYARVKLLALIEKAGRSNVFYCDTDCLFTNQKGYDNLESEMHENKLGYLSVKKVAENIVIYGNKDYEFGNIKRCKGISFKDDQINNNTYIQERWPSFKGIMRQKDKNKYYTTKVKKKLKRVYDKGIVTKSGKIKPFTFPLSEPSLF